MIVRHARILAATIAALLVAGCSDFAVSPPPAGGRAPTSVAPWVAEADAVARTIARAMSRSDVRTVVRDAMRASRVTEHKLVLQEFAATPAGQQVIAAAAAASGVSAGDLTARISALPRLDFYVPFREHRLTWAAGANVVVAVNGGAGLGLTAHDPAGAVVHLDRNAGVPRQTLLVLRREEPKDLRIDPQPDGPGTVIQDSDDGEISGSFRQLGPDGDVRVIPLASLMTRDPENPRRLLMRPEAQSAAFALLTEEECDPRTSKTGCDDDPQPDPDPIPGDTTFLTSLKITYDEHGSFDDYAEPYFKVWYLQHQNELRFQGIRANVQYDVNAILIYTRMAEGTVTGMKLEAWEADQYDFDQHYATASLAPSSRGQWIRLGTPEHSAIVVDWTPKPQPAVSRVEWYSSVVHGESSGSPSGCQSYLGRWINAYSSYGAEIDLTGKTITYGSFDPFVATYDAAAQRVNYNYYPGSTKVTATVDGRTAYLDVTTTPRVASIRVSPTAVTLASGGAAQLTASSYNGGGDQVVSCFYSADGGPAHYPMLPYIWSVDNPAVATVDENGLMRGVSSGTTTVRVKQGSYTTSTTVKVTGPVSRVTVSPSYSSIAVYEAVALTAKGYDASNTVVPGRTATWTSSNSTVASVSSSGFVRGRAVGTATITATIDGVKATARVDVGSTCGSAIYC